MFTKWVRSSRVGYAAELRQTFYCVGPVVMLFVGLWCIFGFVMCSDLDPDTASTVILFWCIGQFTMTVLIPLTICCCDLRDRRFEYTGFSEDIVQEFTAVIVYGPSAIKIGKAIAAMAIGMAFDCNASASSDGFSLFEWMDINSWILMAGFTDFVMTVMWLSFSFKFDTEDWEGEAERANNWTWTAFCVLWMYSFDVFWAVCGFMVWANVSADGVCLNVPRSAAVMRWRLSVPPPNTDQHHLSATSVDSMSR